MKSLKEQLIGTWTIVSWDQVGKDGKNFQRFGANPKGVHVFDASGRFFGMFARPDLPKFKVSDPMRTTADENRAVMEGSIAYFGTYSVDEAGKSISIRLEFQHVPEPSWRRAEADDRLDIGQRPEAHQPEYIDRWRDHLRHEASRTSRRQLTRLL